MRNTNIYKKCNRLKKKDRVSRRRLRRRRYSFFCFCATKRGRVVHKSRAQTTATTHRHHRPTSSNPLLQLARSRPRAPERTSPAGGTRVSKRSVPRRAGRDAREQRENLKTIVAGKRCLSLLAYFATAKSGSRARRSSPFH